MSIATVIVSAVLALLLLAAGAPKAFNSESAQKAAEHLQVPAGIYGVVGVLEGSAAIGLIAGLFWPPLAIAASVAVVGLMLGAIVSHRKAGDPVAKLAPAVLVALLAAATVTLTVFDRF